MSYSQYFFDKIFSVTMHFISSAAVWVPRSSHKYQLGFSGHFCIAGTVEHKASSPGSGAPWPLGGTTAKQIKSIFCAGPGFHLPPQAAEPGGDSQHSRARPSLCWLRLSLPIRQHGTAAGQIYSCSVLDALVTEHKNTFISLPATFCKSLRCRRMRMLVQHVLSFQLLISSYSATQLSSLQRSDPEEESFLPSTSASHCPLGGISQVPTLENTQAITLTVNASKGHWQALKAAQSL